MVEPLNENSEKSALEDRIRDDLRQNLPDFAIKRIFWQNSIPVDSRHNAKIHRLALARKWTKLVASDPELGLPK